MTPTEERKGGHRGSARRKDGQGQTGEPKDNCIQWSAGSRELGDCAARSATALVDGMLQGDRTEDERVTVTNVTRI